VVQPATAQTTRWYGRIADLPSPGLGTFATLVKEAALDEVEFGRYRLIELIGEGAMGKVYKAFDTAIGRNVAIKVLPAELAQQRGYRERFRREALTAARLTEPHIIPIYDTGEIDGHLFLSMPVIDGTDIASLIRRDGAMTPELAVKVIEQLASALDAAHANGLVHRDVKPSNALMTGHTFVYLIDFGIAHDVEATRLTQTGMVVGTIAYMAPERLSNGITDARADIYALACVLHECLTGKLPYPGGSVEQMMAGHLTMDPPQPTTVNPAVPAGFDAVIARGMAKDPERRYQTAAQLAVAARRALAEATVAAEGGATRPISDRPEDDATPAPHEAVTAAASLPTVAEKTPAVPTPAAQTPAVPTPAAQTPAAQTRVAPTPAASRASAAGDLATLLSPAIPFVVAAVLAAAAAAVAVIGLGTPPRGGDLPPGAVTIAGTDPTGSGEVSVDLSRPIPVTVTAPGADSVTLALDVLGAPVGRKETPLAPADRSTTLPPPVNRYVLAGRMTAQITVLHNHTPLGTYRFVLKSAQSATTTVTAAVTLVLTLLACAYIESNLRVLRRGRESPLAVLVVPMFAAALAAAAVAAAWILVGHPPTVATLACSAGLAAVAGFAAVIGAHRLGGRYRNRRSGRARS
jgi:tRNA A-37 threonylcarbamoyl transferase component Bud32